jgi:capsular polysaccharide transport system ATP-binding protein
MFSRLRAAWARPEAQPEDQPAPDRRMIALREVTKGYTVEGHRKRVLTGINCVIPFGTNLGIVGVNGSGKSTLVRILAGVVEPDTGEVTRVGSVSWPVARASGFHPKMTGEENARFIARLYGIDVQETVDYVSDFAEIGPAMKEEVQTYSSGMRARLGFAMSMAVKFDFYLVDEVLAVGDQRFQEKCRRAFVERRETATVVMISHQVSTLRLFCDTAAILHAGKLVFYDTVEQAMRMYGPVTGGRPVWEAAAAEPEVWDSH